MEMETRGFAVQRTRREDATGRAALGALSPVLRGARWCAFWILRFCQPLAALLWGLAIGGVGLWVLFVLIAGDTEFPTGRVLGMSVGCGLGAVIYYALLEWLRPVSRGH